ncbi:hypothetical protein [Phenylobacterium montanum]|uniref:Uncharacterized protein n=1 Tax=Phenylobacterium montanum TaxID=2823693 RepID=A0A975IWG1_9CAUL|nr:hypothetical protein [Caulobacter sp. S6]QUD89805.1 hypothetical protein KCG34_08025 [Caulobacter sp. S6]
MRGGPLPPALLCAAIGLALGYAPWRTGLLACLVVTAVSAAVSILSLPQAWTDLIFAGCWISVALSAACVHLPHRIGLPGAVLLAVNGGVWAGMVAKAGGDGPTLMIALPLLLLCLPSHWLAVSGRGVAVKVAASWLIAIAGLELMVGLTPTPGYKPDHMD